eukprot:245334_1
MKMSEVKQENDTLCAGCAQKTGTKKCSGCKQTYYCSQTCQVNHWHDHKSKCKQIRKQNKTKQQKSPTKSNLSKSLAENMKIQYEKENKKNRTPRIKVTKAINGVFKVKLLNKFLTNREKSIEFQYDYKLINSNQWKTTTFTTDLLGPKGLFFVRMPLNLKGYRIKCRLRARLTSKQINNTNNNDKKWFDFSKE